MIESKSSGAGLVVVSNWLTELQQLTVAAMRDPMVIFNPELLSTTKYFTLPSARLFVRH